MCDAERSDLKYQIALTLAPAIGPVTARKLIEKFGSPRRIFEQKKWRFFQQISGIGPSMSASFHPKELLEEAERELKFMDRYQVSALYVKDPGYPQLLSECPDAPLVLFTRGEQGLDCTKSLSVVGTRRATSPTIWTTISFPTPARPWSGSPPRSSLPPITTRRPHPPSRPSRRSTPPLRRR